MDEKIEKSEIISLSDAINALKLSVDGTNQRIDNFLNRIQKTDKKSVSLKRKILSAILMFYPIIMILFISASDKDHHNKVSDVAKEMDFLVKQASILLSSNSQTFHIS